MSERARFTTGPWEVYGANHIVKFGENHAEIATILGPDSGGQFAGSGEALDPGDERWGEGCANADLIAAAPDLYESLVDASEYLHDDPNDERDQALSALKAKIRAALARAEGRNG